MNPKEHTLYMEKTEKCNIQYSIDNSLIFTDLPDIIKDIKPIFILENIDSVSAGLKYPNSVILNFASYTKPGGGFINGAIAQEEDLCSAGFLYNVLKEFPDYYEWNKKHLNNHLYRNRAIFSPKIKFKDKYRDVITCAAPNYRGQRDNLRELWSRIKFINSICCKLNINTIILGAFGCGVFNQNPYEVAKLFKKYMTVEKVILAVPSSGNNYNAFREVFSGM